MSAKFKSFRCRDQAKGLYLDHCFGRARLVVGVNAEVLRNMPEPFREAGQSWRFALQFADQHLSRATLDESLECAGFQTVMGSSEEKDSADGKA
jgi:hypothetical protein